ncbi:TetR/AcrR family transcriptional regulator [Mesorhizobium sp. VK24D]|uniref:TetR/AcrR family transcriptional regulator n=1 Tax=Mesorhizobium album TaxID=3072314 RepID=A0ABU4XWB2_9HYPH|nr:TetR/AcrR family transcriptional regulator [Mesorhizobium sp. VK24D]MDX8477952.1 TetR/AcrR family transcriptional regulator [Mesorhizobium sp. VK24D]
MSQIGQKQHPDHERSGLAKRPIDRRVARTRGMLHQALLSLILEKGYEAILVEDICERANIGRSTFYAHFTSKDDLKRSGLEHLRLELLERHRSSLTSMPTGIRPFGFSLPMFEHARDHMHLYQALVGSKGGAIALDTIRQTLCDFVRSELAAAGGKDPTGVPREFIVRHVVGAYMAVLTWWLESGATLPPQQMDEFFRRLMNEGAASSYS